MEEEPWSETAPPPRNFQQAILVCLATVVLVCCEEAGPEPLDELPGAALRAEGAEHGPELAVAEPLPIGFDAESWREYLIDRIFTGQRVAIGGIDVIVAEMDEPLAYDGDCPTAELVPVSAEELELAGAKPGDEAPGSTPLKRRLYVLSPAGGDGGAADADGDPPRGGPLVDVNPDMWDVRYGAGLAFGKDSGIELTGCTQTGALPVWNAYRLGEACFSGYYSGNSECVEVLLPVKPCLLPQPQTVTSWYAKLFSVTLLIWTPSGWEMVEYLFWLVYKPQTWMTVGEDGWDDIVLRADKQAADRPVMVHGFNVLHNDKSITGQKLYTNPLDLGAPPEEIDLSPVIWGHKQSLVFNSASAIVLRAVEDFSQAASTKYPVYPSSLTWSGMTLPRKWCSEFSSWAIRLGADDAGYPGYFAGIPEASDAQQDIGVAHFFEWADVQQPARLTFFGSDIFPLQPGDPWNGATDVQWAALAGSVQPGDFVARWHEIPDPQAPSGVSDSGHAMIVVGWLADDGSGVGSQHFDPNRVCNRLLVVGGNEEGYGYMDTGLGGIVNVGPRVVCKEPLTDPVTGLPLLRPDGFYERPGCDIDGDLKTNEPGDEATGQPEERCNILLYDRLPSSNATKAAFFVSTVMP
jgi:hypothetical protein